MSFFKEEPPKVEPPKENRKVKYSDLKKCIFKKESGELSEGCKELLNKISED